MLSKQESLHHCRFFAVTANPIHSLFVCYSDNIMPTTKDYERFFRTADSDNSGALSKSELTRVLRKNGYSGSDDDLQNFFLHCDASGDGNITLDEYMKAMGAVPEVNHKEAALMRVFRSFDKDGSGHIDHAELTAVFNEVRRDLSDAEVQRLIELGDKDGSGALEYKEFIKMAFGR